MLQPFVLLPPMILAAVLVASGIAKFRHADDLAGWRDLGVPRIFLRPWLVRFHPWGELVLALALVVLGGVFGLLAATACLGLMCAYLWLVWRAVVRARRSDEDATCACFGSKRRLSSLTIVRNAWLALLALVAVAGIWTTPLFGGAIAAVNGEEWSWILGAFAAALTTALVLWSERDDIPVDAVPEHGAQISQPAGVASDLDYVRTRTPAVLVTLADGTVANLRGLSMRKPLLLMAVSMTCGACQTVIAAVPGWRMQLPEVDIRFLLRDPPGTSALVEAAEPQSLHDPDGNVRASILEWPTPTAVLLGIDGMLAGGPVSGSDQITSFVDDIRASLDELTTSAPPVHFP